MERIKSLLQNPALSAGVAFVVGLFVGLVVLGWWLWPVKWTDASPAHLRADYQEDYLRMAIDSYELRGDVGLAQQRFLSLGEQGPEVLQRILADPREQSPAAIQAFQAVVGGPLAAPPGVTATPERSATGKSSRLGGFSLVLLLCGLTLVVAVGLVCSREGPKSRRPRCRWPRRLPARPRSPTTSPWAVSRRSPSI